MDKFPEQVNVTEQEVNISSLSSDWKQKTSFVAQEIINRYNSSGKERFIVAIGGPSGSGKSTTAAVVKHIIDESDQDVAIVNVSQDAYHYSNSYLRGKSTDDGKSLKDYKGRHDTFDATALKLDLLSFMEGKEVSFPYYSRETHEPLAHKITVSSGPAVLIIEGLWVLWDKSPWKDLIPLYDYTVFMNGDPHEMKQHAVSRHIRGGRSEQDAEDFYENSDLVNMNAILENISKHDYHFWVV